MNIDQLSKVVADTFNIPAWEASSRVEFNVSELELDPNNVDPAGIADVVRCIRLDLEAGK